MRFKMISVGLLVAVAATSQGVNLKQVPAGTKWLVDVDVRTMTDSETGRFFKENTPASSPHVARMKAFGAMTGIDFAKDVSTITVFGEDVGENGAVAILHGTWDIDKLSALLPLAKNFTAQKYGEHTVMSWEDRTPRFVCFVSTELAVFAANEERLRLALDTLDGRKPNLMANEAFADINPVAKKPFVIMQAVGVNTLAKGQQQAAALQNTEALRLMITEAPATKNVALDIELTSVSPDAADQMSRMLQGMQAMAQMQGANNPEMFDLANTFKIETKGKKVTLNASLRQDLLKRVMDTMTRMRDGQGAVGAPMPDVPPAFE